MIGSEIKERKEPNHGIERMKAHEQKHSSSSSSSSSSCVFRGRILPEIWKSHITPFLHPREVCFVTSTCKFARDELLRGVCFTSSRAILPDMDKFMRRTGTKVGGNFTLRKPRIQQCIHTHLHLEYDKHPIRKKALATKEGKVIIPVDYHDNGEWAFVVRNLYGNSNDGADQDLQMDRLVSMGSKTERHLYVSCNEDNSGEFLTVQLGLTKNDMSSPAHIYFARKAVEKGCDETIRLELPANALEAACMSKKEKNRLIVSTGPNLRVYDITTGKSKCEAVIPFFDDFYCIKIVALESGDDELILCADERGCMQLWDIRNEVCRGLDVQLLQIYFGHTYTICALEAFAFGVYGSLDNFIRIFHILPVQATSNSPHYYSFECAHVLGGHKGIVTSLIHFNDFENTLISSSDDQSIKVWKTQPKTGYYCSRSIRVHNNCVETTMIHPSPVHQSIISISCDLQVCVTSLDDSYMLRTDDGSGVPCRYKNDYDSEEEYFDADGYFRK